MSNFTIPKFPVTKHSLHAELKKRVQAYFDDLGIVSTGTASLFTKAISMVIALIVVYIHLLVWTPVWYLAILECIILGGLIAVSCINNPNSIQVNPKLVAELKGYGITNYSQLIPVDIFNWHALFQLKGLLLMVFGGCLVGFGTRYAGGCTSGHAITGLSNLQWPSLVATCCFMIGGYIMANWILPFILQL